MKCPRCETPSMIEMDRNGITIDRCDRCRGVWLDRGELEKLIARAGREDEEYLERERPRASDDRYERDSYRRDEDYRRDHDDSDVFRRKRKKRGSFMDIFDFD
jgi:uncharacterized protein